MNEIFDFVRPLISGGFAILVMYLFMRFTKSESRRTGSVRFLEFGKAFKFLTVLCGAIAVFVLYVALHASEDQKILALSISSLLIAVEIFLIYQVFFVKFGYDDEFVYYSSLFVGRKKVGWEYLEETGYSWLVQADYIRMKGIGKIWCSNYLNGYEELGKFLEQITAKIDNDFR